jgi:RimJ/RimL family protein N-acetyltransferase
MLFCKPSLQNDIVFERSLKTGQQIILRGLILIKDLNTLHQWVNQPYAGFWQLQVSRNEMESVYQDLLQNENTHSFVGLIDDVLICQMDVYRVKASELGKFISAEPNDCGLHFLMAPVDKTINGLSSELLQTYIAWHFSHPESTCLYAEPDIDNHKAHRLLERNGFSFLRKIILSDKIANLYSISKQQFHATNK